MAALPDAGIGKPLVPRDVTKDSRLRRFTEVVAQMLNSLLIRGQMKQLTADSWTIVTAASDGTAGLTGTFHSGSFGVG